MAQKWRPKTRPQDVRVGKYFMLSDFLYSEDAILSGIANCPVGWDCFEIDGMKGLCKHILDPVVEEFGAVSITFGYVSPQLWRKWNGANAELSGLHLFRPPQGGIGGAVDILIHSHSEDPRPVLNWIRDRCVYDRLILYPGSAILCVAWTQNKPRYHCKEWVFGASGSDRHYVNAGQNEPASAPKPKKPIPEQGRLFLRMLGDRLIEQQR
jgi:hypothetical protein